MLKDNKWFKFFLVYFSGVLVCLSQLKIAPIGKQIGELYNYTDSDLTLLTSVFTISGIILALPGGKLVSKFGAKRLLIGLMLCLMLGNLIGYFVSSFSLLLVSRVIEGISFSMIVMVGIVLITYWFSTEKSGTPIGIWGTFSALGSLVAFKGFLPFITAFDVKSLWLMCALCALAFAALTFLFIDGPEDAAKKTTDESSNESPSNITLKDVLANKSILFLAIAMGAMSFVLWLFIYEYTNFFQGFYLIEQNQANHYVSFFGLFGIPIGVVAGIIIDKIGKSTLLACLGFSLMAASIVFGLSLNPDNGTMILLQVGLLSNSIGLAASCVAIMAPRFVKRPELIGYSVSFIYLFYYIGAFCGPMVVRWFIDHFSWPVGLWLLVLVACIGLCSVIAATIIRQKSSEIVEQKAPVAD